MTAFIGLIGKDFAILGTDTLATYPKQNGDTQLRPRSYTCKTFLLPQFKSAFSVTGTLQTGLCFFNLIVESAFGIDIDSLTNIELKHFNQKLKSDYQEYPTGSIYLTGFSNKLKCFKGFKLLVDGKTDLNWQEIPQDSLVFKPDLDDWENKIPKTENQRSYKECIIDLMRLQKEEDEQKDLADQVGIGGHILYTQLGLDKDTENLTIVTQIIHQFDDYLSIGNEMTNN